MVRELGIGAGNGIGAAEVFRLKRLAIGSENELSLLCRRPGAISQRFKRRIHLAWGAGSDMDVAPLEYGSGHVGLVGVACLQPGDCGVLASEGAQKLERELGPVERLKCKFGYSFFDLNGVHVGTLREEPDSAKPTIWFLRRRASRLTDC